MRERHPLSIGTDFSQLRHVLLSESKFGKTIFPLYFKYLFQALTPAPAGTATRSSPVGRSWTNTAPTAGRGKGIGPKKLFSIMFSNCLLSFTFFLLKYLTFIRFFEFHFENCEIRLKIFEDDEKHQTF